MSELSHVRVQLRFQIRMYTYILVMCSYSTEMASELVYSKLKIDYRLFVGMILVDRLSFHLLVKIVNFIVSQFKMKINYLYFSNTPYYRTLTTVSPSNQSHIYKA